MRVRVPFGASRRVGLILEMARSTDQPEHRLRAVEAVLDAEPVLPPDLLALARWAAGYYHHPPGEVLATMLPVLLRRGEPARRRCAWGWQLTAAGREALESGATRRAPRQRGILQRLVQAPAGLYAGDLGGAAAALRTLEGKGWIRRVMIEDPGVEPPQRTPAPVPTAAQAQAVAVITAALGGFGAFLLDGVTGSGKTEVYLQVVEAAAARGAQALILVPEIGLTPQLVERFARRLPGPLAVLHSGLGERERLDAWLQAAAGESPVVIGTRSAVFTPLRRPGVIILDEEHDASFKQQEGFRYSARDLAVMRARQLAIPVVLGSATPSLESLHNAVRGRYTALRLPERAGAARPPALELLDIRRQPMKAGLAGAFLAETGEHLARAGQVLVFLNRRGFAPTLICHECGWLSQCQRCDARLTLHLARRQLICHHCGARRAVETACPGCGSVDLRTLGQGTERIESTLRQLFPNAGVVRLDRDSTRRRGSLETLLARIRSGEHRILIGTQMLAKGHDFPDVTLVGVVDADQGLFGTDFRASERMAQLIVQVAGRAGRAERPGRVLIQTHHPDHPLLVTLTREGYDAFAAAALAEREAAGLPPFAHQALLRAESPRPEAPMGFLGAALAAGLALEPQSVELMGPIPAPMERRAGRYRAQLLAQATRRGELHVFLGPWVAALESLEAGRQVRWSLDVDPVDLL